MPRRRDIESICLIGSGPIVIGQACEFDYAGCQALKVLREDGFKTIVVNSNPATIMTDPGFADLRAPRAARPRGRRRRLSGSGPDALLPTMGGQMALNLAVHLGEEGILADLGVELIGAPIDVIRRAMTASTGDRARSRPARPGIDHRDRDRRASRRSLAARDPPARIRHAGRPRRRHRTHPESSTGCSSGRYPRARSARCSSRSRSSAGRVRARADARPRGQRRRRLLDREHRSDGRPHRRLGDRCAPDDAVRRRVPGACDAAIAVIRAVGVDCGGSNIQFARNRESGSARSR